MSSRVSEAKIMNKKNRIGIFFVNSTLQYYNIDFIKNLVDNNYVVDLFFKDMRIDKLIDANYITFNENINLHSIQNPYIYRFIIKFFNKILKLFANLIKIQPRLIIDNHLYIIKAKKIMLDNINYYKCLIGIEKFGLIWAGATNKSFNIPLIYHSLELYLEDNPKSKNNWWFSALREKEKKYHAQCVATIIQDKMRAKVLLESNNVSTDLIFLPVSINGQINEMKSTYLYGTFNIPEDKIIILYYGMISQLSRLCFDIAQSLSKIDKKYILVFHGYPRPGENIDILKSYRNVILSLNLVEHEKKQELISSATIGLTIYDNTNNNDRLTAFSSSKVAEFLQCGIPIIAYDNESYRVLTSQFSCGELISNLRELPIAVNKIMDNYEFYRKNAFNAFDEFYNGKKYYRKIINYLEKM